MAHDERARSSDDPARSVERAEEREEDFDRFLSRLESLPSTDLTSDDWTMDLAEGREETPTFEPIAEWSARDLARAPDETRNVKRQRGRRRRRRRARRRGDARKVSKPSCSSSERPSSPRRSRRSKRFKRRVYSPTPCSSPGRRFRDSARPLGARRRGDSPAAASPRAFRTQTRARRPSRTRHNIDTSSNC